MALEKDIVTQMLSEEYSTRDLVLAFDREIKPLYRETAYYRRFRNYLNEASEDEKFLILDRYSKCCDYIMMQAILELFDIETNNPRNFLISTKKH